MSKFTGLKIKFHFGYFTLSVEALKQFISKGCILVLSFFFLCELLLLA